MKKSVPWLYFFAMVAQMIGGTIAGTYLVFYMTSRMLIAAAVMGTILLVSRIVDLVIGMLSGAVVQKLCFKHGQYRFWLLYGPLAVSIGTTLCFINPSIPVMAKAVIVFFGIYSLRRRYELYPDIPEWAYGKNRRSQYRGQAGPYQ